jgi:hypothetical protein
MKRLSPTDIITAAHVEAILRDINTDKQVDLVKPQRRPRPLPRPLPEELSPGFRRVHAETNGFEREPIDSEPFTIVQRKGDWEYCILPVFKSLDGLRIVRPRPDGPWEICECSDEEFDAELDDGTRQGWFVWIRLAREVRLAREAGHD